jgi:protein-S-isoprenylcysteine O-methyltransferase Ste14
MLKGRQPPRENAMADGLILLAFIAILGALFTVRMRRRMGIASSARTWYMVITGVILVGLVLWVATLPQ